LPSDVNCKKPNQNEEVEEGKGRNSISLSLLGRPILSKELFIKRLSYGEEEEEEDKRANVNMVR